MHRAAEEMERRITTVAERAATTTVNDIEHTVGLTRATLGRWNAEVIVNPSDEIVEEVTVKTQPAPQAEGVGKRG